MRKVFSYKPDDINSFLTKSLVWSSKFENVILLNTNNFYDKFGINYNLILAAGSQKKLISNHNSFEKLKKFHQENKDWMFGYLSYDIKNETENLKSENYDGINADNLYFFIPKYLFFFSNDSVEIKYRENNIDNIIPDIESIKTTKTNEVFPEIKKRFDKNDYIKTVAQIKEHIQRGDIYEANYCIEHFAENAEINPVQTYLKLNNISPAPFSCFLRTGDIFLMSASPERYLKKTGKKIISQPIKGTIKRGVTKKEDELLKKELKNDPKEKSENIMIVDLVRNDLSITAAKKSVKVEELCEIYSFEHVHQMISTVTSKISEKHHFIDTIKNSFPMGSMTGAPKIKAMEIIEKFEKTKRGIFSGSVGYITPDEDFDFNVIIRSILYNRKTKYLSFITGGAITGKSTAEKEFEECLLKAGAILKIFKT